MVDSGKLNIPRGQTPDIILKHIKAHVESWEAVTLDQISVAKLSGLSNSCYRVHVEAPSAVQPTTLLYRKFECELIDKRVEATIFESMSSQGLGPKLLFQNTEYRIEEFFDGRQITIWEMRNPSVLK